MSDSQPKAGDNPPKSELILTLEYMLARRTRMFGPNAPETLDIQRQLDAATARPISLKAMFLMGGRSHSGNIPIRPSARKRGKK